MHEIHLLELWIIIASVVAIIAMSKKRSGPQWFVYGLALLPVALIHALVIE